MNKLKRKYFRSFIPHNGEKHFLFNKDIFYVKTEQGINDKVWCKAYSVKDKRIRVPKKDSCENHSMLEAVN